MSRRFHGRVAIVTGAGSGMGAVIAQRLAEEGMAVACVGRRAAQVERTRDEIIRLGGRAAACSVDVANERAVIDLFGQVEAELGLVDDLFNVAGVWLGGRLPDDTTETLERTLATNVRGPWLCSREHVRRRIAAGAAGTIVSVASFDAHFVSGETTTYAASKGALCSLSRSIAFDHGPQRIRANVICPGWIETPMSDRYLTPETMKALVEAHPLRRIGTADDVAAVALFLASDEAQFITGQEVTVDGGLSIGRRMLPAEASWQRDVEPMPLSGAAPQLP